MPHDDRSVPAYPSRARLAHELDCAESTIDELVKRGILPPPTHLSRSVVRWDWAAVVAAIASLKNPATGPAEDADPYISGVKNALKEISPPRQR